jgi:hypothetical protein
MKKIILSSFVALLALLSGCNKFLDVNVNPNAPTATQPGLVLSGALITTNNINIPVMGRYARQWAGYASASGSYSQSGDVLRNYDLQSTSSENLWTSLYLNVGNYNYVENAARSTANSEYFVAIAKIMKVWCFQNLVDNFGNVPYTDALQGFNILTPKYDDAKTIYEALNVQLDSAVNIINNAKTPIPVTTASDVMFSGNMTSWIKFANTLRLRLLMHQSQMAGRDVYIKGEIAKIKGGYLTTDANINPGYLKADQKQNPFWETFGFAVDGSVGGRRYEKPSAYAVNYFVNSKDPRLPLYITKSSAGGVYNGVPFGQPADVNFDLTHSSDFGPGLLKGPDQDSPLITGAESLFIQAEAAQRGWLTGTAQTLYESGVKASFATLGLPDSTATNYLVSPTKNVNWNDPATTDKIEAIITQKWAAMYMTDAMEAWTDFRRLNLPKGIPASIDPAKIGPKSPNRLYYVQSEYNLNKDNLNAVGLTGAYQFTKIFWQN